MTVMVDTDSDEAGRNGSVSRRTFVKAAGVSGAAASLAGCIYGDGGGDSGGPTEVVWGFDSSAAQEVGDQIKQAFHEVGGLSNDIKIKFQPGVADSGARRDNYNTLLNAGRSKPDLFLMDNGWLNTFIARQQVQNLTELLPQSTVSTINNQYFEGFTATATGPNGDLFGAPMYPDFPTMLYRKDLAEKAGFNPESENWATKPMTWKKFSQFVSQTSQQTDTQHGFTFQGAIYEGLSCCTFNEFMSSWGGAYFGGRKYLFGPVGKRPVTVDKKPVLNSLRMLRTFIHGTNDQHSLDGYAGQIAPASVLSWKEDQSLGPFVSGNAVAHRNWPYAITEAASKDNFGQDLGVMPIPYAVPESKALEPGTGGTTSALGGWHIVANPHSENKEAAKEVIRTHVESDKLQLKIMEIWGWLPPKRKLFESNRAQNVKPIGRYLDTLKIAGENTMPRPVTVVWPNEASAIASKVNGVVSQKAAPDQGMSQLKSQLQKIENQA